MFVIRNVFNCNPGEAKDLVQKFKAVAPHMERNGISRTRVLTDMVAEYWTVVLELEVESLDDWISSMSADRNDDAFKPMQGYMDHLLGGHREIWRVE